MKMMKERKMDLLYYVKGRVVEEVFFVNFLKKLSNLKNYKKKKINFEAFNIPSKNAFSY